MRRTGWVLLAILSVSVLLPQPLLLLGVFYALVGLIGWGIAKFVGKQRVTVRRALAERPQTVTASAEGGAELTGALEDYYRVNGIWPTEFRCRHLPTCSAGEDAFTFAKASFVGPLYFGGPHPRIVFLSLDSGDGSEDPSRHTLAAVRTIELERDVARLTKTQHWYLTHALAYELLREFVPSLRVESTTPYFSHVNTAKCSVNRPGRREAPKRLATNCQQYLPGELAILKPDILVTQGASAREAVMRQLAVLHHRELKVEKATGATGVIQGLADGGTLWLSTHHPSAYGVFWPQKTHLWPLYRQLAVDFVRARSRASSGTIAP